MIVLIKKDIQEGTVRQSLTVILSFYNAWSKKICHTGPRRGAKWKTN